MKREPEVFDDDNHLSLAPQLLDAWPEPPPHRGLTDRVLAHCEPARAELQANAQSPAEPGEPPVMQPTPLRHPSQRSILMPVVLGFAAAAAMLLAFYLGRGSAPSPSPSAVPPTVELNVAAPPLTVQTPPPVPSQEGQPQTLVATAYADGRIKVGDKMFDSSEVGTAFKNGREQHDALTLVIDEELSADPATEDALVTDVLSAAREAGFDRLSIETVAERPEVGTDDVSEPTAADPPAAPRRPRSKRARPSSRDLKNPFGDDGSAPVNPMPSTATPRSPSAKPAKSPFGDTPPEKSGSADLENPFEPERGTLRIGTNPGEPSARIEIDGQDRGQTPLVRVSVSTGKHTVIFHWPDGSSTTKTVVVKSGQSHLVRGQR